jgi:hypothetical protein
MATIKLGRYEVERRDLPNLCMRCAAPATTRRDRTFAWYPPWVLIFILVALLVAVILAAVLTKRMRVSVPLCDQHRNHWLNRSLFIGLGFLLVVALAIGAGVLSANVNSDAVIGITWLLVALAFIGWLLGLVVAQSTAIRPTEITDRSITLTGVAQEFADTVMDERERLDREEEYYDDRPRARVEQRDRYYDRDQSRTRRRSDDDDRYYERDRPRSRRPERSRDEEDN